MRFGRVLGPDALAVSDQYRGRVPHIRKVSMDRQEVFIDLNVPGIQAYSDADFPDWQGWTFIDDDTDGNSRCDSKKLVDLILAQPPPPEPEAARQEAQAAPAAEPPTPAQQQRDRLWRAYHGCNESAVRERLNRCVVKMPTEWARDDFDARWGWVKNAPGDAPSNVLLEACLSPEAYEKFKRHHSALAFWEDARAAGLTLDKVHYHFHPKVFVETLKMCGWLSESEFTQLLPTEVLNEVGSKVFIEVVPNSYAQGPIAITHRVPINKVLRKYAINTPPRMATFFGNAMQETQWLSKLRENDNTRWHYPWDGRGFLQLTGPVNYLSYWIFRGRGGQITNATRDALTNAQAQADIHRSTAQNYINDNVSGITTEMLGWRQDIGDNDNLVRDLVAPSDSAGYYWARTNMAKYADRGGALQRRGVSATYHPDRNHSDTVQQAATEIYYHNDNFRDASAAVNLPAAVGNPNKSFNGYIARCVPYALVLAVVGCVQFPDAAGTLTLLFPEGQKPRRAQL